jgi:Mg-chelatase subunit ChlD
MFMDNPNPKHERIIKHLAKNFSIVKNFEDICVTKTDMPTVAFVNIKDRILYINLNSKIMDFDEIMKCLNGMITHENGHLDKRFKVPSDVKTRLSHLEEIERLKIPKEYLDFVYDMEIHYQYNIRKNISPRNRIDLQEFLTMTRNKVLNTNPKDLILSMEYPQTKEQSFVKSVIENRNLSVIEKAKRIYKADKSKGKNITELTIIIDQKNDREGRGRVKGKKRGKNEGKIKKAIEKSESIGKRIIKENKRKLAIEKLKSMGFSNEEINELLEKHDISDIISKVDYLEDSFKSVIPDLENRLSKQRTKEKIESKGQRINGYKRLNDYSKVTENIEDFITTSKHDIDDMRIPYKVDRKRSGTVVLLRDTSGSMTEETIGKMARDITITLIKLAQKNRHKVAVIDFHSVVQPIEDSKGNVLTTQYNRLMLESMSFKSGYSTRLAHALHYVDKLIKENNLKDIPINIFIITDSYVDYNEDLSKLKNAKKVNMVGLWLDVDSDIIDDNLESTIKANNGKVYHINRIKDKLVTVLHKEY